MIAAETQTAYRFARGRGLNAQTSLEYAKAKAVVDASDLSWFGEPDDENRGELALFVVNDDGEVLDALGGVEVEFTVSDHGNVHYDEHDPYLVWLVAEMMEAHA